MITSVTQEVRVEPRTLDIARLDARISVRTRDLRAIDPVGGRVVVTKEKAAWTTPALRVRKRVGGQLVDFATAITIAAPSGSGDSVELPADELRGDIEIVVAAAAVESGAMASVGFEFDYPVEQRGAVAVAVG